jgi:hypothetical protein
MNNIPFFNYLDLFAQHREELTDVFQGIIALVFGVIALSTETV